VSSANPDSAQPPQSAQEISARAPEGPVLVSPRKPVYVHDEADNSLLSHLGLPFYYRHTPPKSMQRGMLWVVGIALMIQFFINLLFMPYPRDSVMTLIRVAIFDAHPFVTIEDGLRSVFTQMMIFSTILSCICAPMLATLSLSNERGHGTIEFLRLAPLSMQSIVLGKMFAPAYVLHVISSVLLLLGAAAGLGGGIKLTAVSLCVASIIASTVTFHAVGAYCACLPAARGAAAVLGLLMGMCFISVFPLSAWEIPGMSFLAYISPWGTLDSEIWHAGRSRWAMQNPEAFFGYAGGVKFYMLAFHVVTSTLLVWAASRKLDTPERPALPWRAWIGLWAFLVITAIGAKYNVGDSLLKMIGGSGITRDMSWAIAALVMGVSGLAVCSLMVSDHPHHRDTALADECEFLARGDTRGRGMFYRLRHGLFSTCMVFATAAVILLFLQRSSAMSGDEWNVALTVSGLAVFAAFFISLILEVAFLGFDTFMAQSFIGMGVSGIFAVSIIVPIVMVAASHSDFHRAAMFANAHFAAQNLNAARGGSSGGTQPAIYVQPGRKRQSAQAQLSWGNQDLLHLPEVKEYLPGVTTLKEVNDLEKRFLNRPLAFYLHYHPNRLLVFIAIFLGVIGGVIFWRHRVYAGLRAEAHKAVFGNKPAPVIVAAEAVPA
jgi:hypothetical protein